MFQSASSWSSIIVSFVFGSAPSQQIVRNLDVIQTAFIIYPPWSSKWPMLAPPSRLIKACRVPVQTLILPSFRFFFRWGAPRSWSNGAGTSEGFYGWEKSFWIHRDYGWSLWRFVFCFSRLKQKQNTRYYAAPLRPAELCPGPGAAWLCSSRETWGARLGWRILTRLKLLCVQQSMFCRTMNFSCKC